MFKFCNFGMENLTYIREVAHSMKLNELKDHFQTGPRVTLDGAVSRFEPQGAYSPSGKPVLSTWSLEPEVSLKLEASGLKLWHRCRSLACNLLNFEWRYEN